MQRPQSTLTISSWQDIAQHFRLALGIDVIVKSRQILESGDFGIQKSMLHPHLYASLPLVKVSMCLSYICDTFSSQDSREDTDHYFQPNLSSRTPKTIAIFFSNTQTGQSALFVVKPSSSIEHRKF